MALTGRPLTDGNKRNRNPVEHDWSDVEDVPYVGDVPVELPKSRKVVTKDGVETLPTSPLTVEWWAAVCRMPHCTLWREGDWHFALATAILHDDVVTGKSQAAGELRQREAIMCTTREARMKARIRYVKLDDGDDESTGVDATVSTLADARRSRLADA